jgi:hypothetical protein
MLNYPRYAIYYAPATGSDFDRFGAQLLGYDAFGGEDLSFPDGLTQAAPDWRDLTSDPRKYGFHATLKAPFFTGARQDRDRAVCSMCRVRLNAPAYPGHQACGRFDQRLYQPDRDGAKSSLNMSIFSGEDQVYYGSCEEGRMPTEIFRCKRPSEKPFQFLSLKRCGSVND